MTEIRERCQETHGRPWTFGQSPDGLGFTRRQCGQLRHPRVTISVHIDEMEHLDGDGLMPEPTLEPDWREAHLDSVEEQARRAFPHLTTTIESRHGAGETQGYCDCDLPDEECRHVEDIKQLMDAGGVVHGALEQVIATVDRGS